MQFPRVVSLFFILLTFGLLASSTAVKRSNAQVVTVLNNLKASTGTVIPQISALSTSGKATQQNIAPLVSQLTAAFGTARTSLSGLEFASPLAKRQSEADVAALIASAISEVTLALDSLFVVALVPSLGILLVALDVAIQELLVELDILIAGVLPSILLLLAPVVGILGTVGLGGILGVL